MKYPIIIQGGMGAGVSDWRLAKAVSLQGQLGVVSGTGIDTILVRRLQDGDPGGHMRRAMANFPVPEIAQRILERYYIPGGKAPNAPYKMSSMFSAQPTKALLERTIVANFVEVFLAKEGHEGVVGINLLEKILLPNLPSLYGAMLAGVDYVLMGAGIPREIPGALDGMAEHQEVSLKMHVEGAAAEDDFRMRFNPRSVLEIPLPPLKRPRFLAIIASVTLGLALAKKATGRVDGFVIEGPTAGGHNAPPRGAQQFNERGEPIYGPRDVVDLDKIKEIGLPFWLAGSYANPEKVAAALEAGAQGVQIGTAFALCNESGLARELRDQLLDEAIAGTVDVYTDANASPTGFPFKVARLQGSLSEVEVYEERPRCCDLGYLRTAYKREDGGLGYRCPSEPVDAFLSKGGELAEAQGRKCLCNALMANIGLSQNQQKTGYREQALVTIGDDVKNIVRLLEATGQRTYSAEDVIQYLMSALPGSMAAPEAIGNIAS